jgi:prepilin-type N-terminal cleavage/methylation domain-containing protein
MSRTIKSRTGFTLVELAVVIVIIGVLAAFGVPQFLKSVERSKCAESFNYLSALRSAQERYLAKNGIYWGGTISGTDGALTNDTANGGSSGTEKLDIVQTVPKYFSGDGNVGGDIVVNEDGTTTPGVPTWDCTLVRVSATSSYGDYSVGYDQNGYKSGGVTGHPGGVDISTLPDINPMGN